MHTPQMNGLREGSESAWFGTCPKGMEGLLAAELGTLGATSASETVAGVYFAGPLAVAYRACLWSRLANRVLKTVARVAAEDADRLYAELMGLDWGALFSPAQSLAVDFSGENSAIRNTRFGAQRCKDAVVDWFAQHRGRRPAVDLRDPDIRLNVRLARNEAVVSLDLSGGSLHHRGYRAGSGAAPMKENLAAAVLLRADWPGIAARGGALLDPMCGAATLLLEGAMMVADIAPGLDRRRFGFEHWRGHSDAQWRAILADARGRAERGRARQLPEIRGYDADPRVVRRAQENIARLGLEKVVRVSCKPLAELKRPSHRPLPEGLLVCNPPYGERLGEKESLAFLYRRLGEVAAREFRGWQMALLTADLELGRATGLRSHKRHPLWNGPIPVQLLLFDLRDNEWRDPGDQPRSTQHPEPAHPEQTPSADPGEGGRMFANRIAKNRRRLAPWLRREQVECYRLYDADMPEYAVAVDIYGEHVQVAEYQAPPGVSPAAAQRRLDQVRAALPEALGVPPGAIVFKQRRRQRGADQYGRQGGGGELVSVREGPARLLVNLRDYLDTGLFLDHRPLRMRIGREARGADFLNLFCYTGAATVHAALGGARSTTSVDLSNTYLDWLRKNLAHNGLGETRHLLVRADCLRWLQKPSAPGKARGGEQGRPAPGTPDEPPRFDLILLDPPSFSNSRGMVDTLDVQRDHAALIRGAMALLRETGQLYFSNNRRGFKLDFALEEEYLCREITLQTLDPDFPRSPPPHRCWSFRHRPAD